MRHGEIKEKTGHELSYRVIVCIIFSEGKGEGAGMCGSEEYDF